MLRTNLSTRPFYNDRAVRIGLGAVAVVAAALTAFNVFEVRALRARNDVVMQRAAEDDARTGGLREQARAIRQSLGQAQLERAQAAAREANELIERRAFSWTALFNQFEHTLPPDVRVTAVQPQIDEGGRLLLTMNVVTRSVEALDEFIGALEKTGAFSQVLARQELAGDDGTITVQLQGYYGSAPEPPRAAGDRR